MKRILLAAAAVTMFAGAAQAQVTAVARPDANDTRTITVFGAADAYCGISGQDTSVNLTTNLVNSNAMINSGVQDDIVSKLDGLQLRAFCNGASNLVNLQRQSLVRDGGTRGALTSEGFAQEVIYDLAVKIDGATRSDGFGAETDGSEDGNTGPVTVGRFGPTGQGALVRFQDAATPGAANTASAAVLTGSGQGFGRTTNYQQLSNTRLAAGSYQGQVRLELTPSV